MKYDHFRAFEVFLDGTLIDKVFYAKKDTITEGEVRESLINHDGYDTRIIVREEQ